MSNKKKAALPSDTELRNYFAEMGRRGAKARAERYSHSQLSEWASLGGRPARSKERNSAPHKKSGSASLSVDRGKRRAK
jgi:hypothetical protein